MFPIRVPETPLARYVAQEILEGTAYPIPWPMSDVRVIVDIGANIGAASYYFSRLFPEAQVYAFEPALEAFDLLKINARGRNVSCINVALVPDPEPGPPYPGLLYPGLQDSVTGSMFPNQGTERTAVPIRVQSLEGALRERHLRKIDILKIDTEGMEVPLLLALGKRVWQTNLIYVEYHAAGDRIEIDSLLAKSHILVQGVIRGRHRGELCYAHTAWLPSVPVEPEIVRPKEMW